MAQTQSESSPPPAVSSGYQAVSGLAVAGLTLACLFAAVVAVTSAAGFFQSVPFFLPEWTLVFPLAAMVLCLVAQQQIRNSDGTLAGRKPARIGFWLGLLVALGYFAFLFFTRLAVTQQADAFLRQLGPDAGFFARLQEGQEKPEQIDQAFLLTRKPSERPANLKDLPRLFDRPMKDGPGELTMFRKHFLVQALVRNGAQASIKPLAVQQWGYENNGYKVERHYRVTTGEALFDLRVVAHSTEVPGGQRKWLIVYPPQMRSSLTSAGEGVTACWKSAAAFVQARIDSLAEGKPLDEFRDDSNWERLTGGHANGKELRALLGEILSKKSSGPRAIRGQVGREEHAGPWEIVNGRLRFRCDATLQFPGPGGVPLVAEAQLLVEGTDRQIQGDEELSELARNPISQWRIVTLQVRRIAIMMPQGP